MSCRKRGSGRRVLFPGPEPTVRGTHVRDLDCECMTGGPSIRWTEDNGVEGL